MFDSFRSFIQYLERKGELMRRKNPVNPYLEINRVAKASVEKGGPAIFFEQVEGHHMPVVTGIFGTRERIFAALGTTRESFSKEFNQRLGRVGEFPAKTVKGGPVKERRVAEDDLDLNRLPFTMHGELDGGWYLSSGVSISRDPDSGVRNASFHRVKRHSERRAGI